MQYVGWAVPTIPLIIAIIIPAMPANAWSHSSAQTSMAVDSPASQGGQCPPIRSLLSGVAFGGTQARRHCPNPTNVIVGVDDMVADTYGVRHRDTALA